MALMLGSANLPGNAEYVQKTGRVLLLCLLPYFALALADGLFLPALALEPAQYRAYEAGKLVLLPVACLLIFYYWLRVRPGDYFFTAQRIAYRGWEWIGITFLSVVILDLVFLFADPVVEIAGATVLAPLRWMLSPWLELPPIALNYPAYYDVHKALPDNRLLRPIVALFVSCAAGVFEEIFFRGLWRQVIAALLGPRAVKTYVVSSALIFGLGHWEQGSAGLINATAFGLTAAWLFLKLGDLRPLILAHVIIDLHLLL